MPAVNMLDAKTHLSRLVDSLEQGTEREYIITRHRRPAARLIQRRTADVTQQRLDVAKGQFTVPEDIDTRNDEVAHLFHGGSPV